VLAEEGHEVIRLRRDGSDFGPNDVLWNQDGKIEGIGLLEDLDAIVHLAGEPILGFRWTAKKKNRIWESRVEKTKWLVRVVSQLQKPPRVLVSSSAVGYYGDRGSDFLTEDSEQGGGFLAELCGAWEKEAQQAAQMGIRVVNLRTGLVLTPSGGVLGKMLRPFRFGLGGILGNGRQYMNWIDHDDMLRLILHVIHAEAVNGPVNATSPHPVTNSIFTNILGKIINRPTLIPIPEFAVKVLFGEMGIETLLSSTRALPNVAEDTGFEFLYPDLEKSLKYQLGKSLPV
jgi:uncharacterized protein (TIGR01777 family)